MKSFLPIFCISIMLLNTRINAQTNVQNTGTFYISNNSDTLFITGNFTNTSAAALTNNGQLQVKQNLTNDQAAMAIGTGTLYLNGITAQSVNGAQVFKTYNLVTNNSGGITLNNDLSVSGIHTFSSGLITSSITPNYLVYEAGSSYTGDNDSRHVNGWVKKFGSTDFIFPVGSATYERPTTIKNLSASSEFNCHYYAPTNNIFNLSPPVVQVKANEYWEIDQVSGGTAQVTLNWNHAKVPMDNVLLIDILASYYKSGSWIDAGGSPSATGTVTTTGTVTSNTLNSFGSFTLGYKAFPVPLKLISFTGERRAGISYFQWVTENEQNVDHFEVQRSYDAVVYSTLGSVAGRNTSSLQYYHFEDHSQFNGFAWYRLRSVDIDGKFSYSRIVVLDDNLQMNGSFTVMNPVHSAITIFNKTGSDGLFAYRLFTAGGQLVLMGDINMSINGGVVLPLPVSSTSGIYILELNNDKIRFRQKIIVEK